MTGFHETLDQPGHVTVRDHHPFGDIRQRHAVRRPVELGHQVEARQRDVEPFAQAAAYRALDQGRAGQKAQPQPDLVAVIFREFDGLGLGIEDHDATVPALRLTPAQRVSTDHFDLQIIRGAPQVKMLGAGHFGRLLRFL